MNKRDDLWPRYARLWSVLTIIGLVAVSLAFLIVGRVAVSWAPLSTAVGEGVLASAIVYLLVSLLLEPIRQQAQAQHISAYAIEVAQAQFQRRFETSLPSATFEMSLIPKRDFRDAFVKLLISSTRYDYKGDTANFTTFRLATLERMLEIRRLRDICLCVLDPRATLPIRATAERRVANSLDVTEHKGADDRIAIAVEDQVARIREDVFVTLITLFDIRHSVSATVYLHSDLVFFRCEMFDDGMMLTYYLGAASYPETLQFSSVTRPYQAYRNSLDVTRRFAPSLLRFGTGGPAGDVIDTEDKLVSKLAELKCYIDLTALRGLRDARFEKLRGDLHRGGLRPSVLF